jgi:hypothetical protein
MRCQRLFAIVVATALCITVGLRGQPASCGTGCMQSRFWTIPADDYLKSGRPAFPEDVLSELVKRDDIGLAFSGGGTRSATMTLGQLRGLKRLGWLEHVRYVSAISGGAWAAIPFTFSKRSLDELLGSYLEPADLTMAVVNGPAIGALGVAIADSSLLSGALREGPAEYLAIRSRQPGVSDPLLSQLVNLTNRLRREGERDDKTYARMLGRIFIDGLVEPAVSAQSFSWNGVTTNEMAQLNPGRLGPVVVAHGDRPFMIASGSMVSSRPDYETPLLMPVEYTAMYVGVRQQFGPFGGSYVWPWAYDPIGVGAMTPDATHPGEGVVEVRVDRNRRLSLADIAASTGAAPEVPILNGAGLGGSIGAKVQAAAMFFPHFNHVAFRNGESPAFVPGIPHADGGGVDNLGIMPLLARQVHNIIVFNNTSTRLAEENDEMQALFIPNATATTSDDHRGNDVFDPAKWDTVRAALADAREHQRPQVFCDNGWSVKANRRFNIRAYDGLSICFVYNATASVWEDALPKPVRALVVDPKKPPTADRLDNFPYYKTFGQTKIHLIQLKTRQVNLLSSLTSWIVMQQSTVDAIRANFRIGTGTLPCPRGMTCS